MRKPVNNVTIVGGGASGWLTACRLATEFAADLAAGRLKISLIESAKIGIIGVGESLAPTMPDLLKKLKVSEAEFFRRCDATFKLGGYFTDWNRDSDGQPVTWANPFHGVGGWGGVEPAFYYLRYGMEENRRGQGPSFSELISSSSHMIRAGRGPRPIGAPDFAASTRYAYHMDANGFAAFLMEVATARGVARIVDDVEAVNLDDRGWVESLTLAERGDHPIQFVIDATGFRGVILTQAMGEPFDPYDKYLLNDRAAVVQTPHDDPKDILPATRATGLGAGWGFRVPLFSRVGNGYVFSSKFISDDEACAELLRRAGPGAAGKTPKVLRMRIGKARRSWVNNCVAVGLSSGFVEPLEATAIFTVERTLEWLTRYWPTADFPAALTKRFNTLNDELYVEIIDYIVLHFLLSNRDDTAYWRAVRQELPVPETLLAKLDLWRSIVPRDGDLTSMHFFTGMNYATALISKGFYDDAQDIKPSLNLQPESWMGLKDRMARDITQLVQSTPNHRDLIASIRDGGGGAAAATTPTFSTPA